MARDPPATNYAGQAAFALFSLIWNNFAFHHPDQQSFYSKILDSAGSPTTFGLTSLADWQALKQLQLPRAAGRALSGAGTPVLSTTFTANDGTNELTVEDTSLFYTGTPITVSSTGTLPSPLTAVTTYYVINTSSTTIQLATSLDNAVAGTAIVLTSNGAGLNFITTVNMLYNLGLAWGDEAIALAINQYPNHDHTGQLGYSFMYQGTNADRDFQTSTAPGTINLKVIDKTAGVTGYPSPQRPVQLFQPTLFVNVMIKM